MLKPYRLLPFVFLAGCAQGGPVAGLIARAIPRDVDAAYKGLAHQPTCVMAWAEPGVRRDNPALQLSLSAAVQDKLINVQRADKPDALAGMTFPFSSATVARNQDNHPDWENLSAEAVAGKLNATRLVYVEITDFATRGPASLELYRGSMTGHLRVVETAEDAAGHVTSRVAYDGGQISVVFPKDSPKDGLPNRRETQIAQGTINSFADTVAQRFYRHDEDRD